jgi:hypothetical protein
VNCPTCRTDVVVGELHRGGHPLFASFEAADVESSYLMLPSHPGRLTGSPNSGAADERRSSSSMMAMPNMDGVAFQRALKADPRWARIPVVIFSAYPPADTGDAIGVVANGSADPELPLSLVARACAREVSSPPAA